MKTIFKLSLYLIITFLTFSCVLIKKLSEPDNLILPLSDTTAIREGTIIYGLPRTVFTVFVEMERTLEKPGPYVKFAGDMLGLTDVILSESESWSVEAISVKTHEEMDPSELYIIQSNTLFQTNVLALKKEGLILDLNPELFYSMGNRGSLKESDINIFRISDFGSDEYFQMQSDTVYKRVKVDSRFIRIPYIVEKNKRLSVDQLAERAARRLMEIREGRHLILTGEANVFPQSDAAINELNRMEKEYTELFTGKTWKETRVFSYQIIPDKEMAGKPLNLFKFSELTGPVEDAAKGGIPVVAELIPEQKTKGFTVIKNNQSEEPVPLFDKLFYRVPDVVKLKIRVGSEVLFESRRLIYQFGEVIQLPANYIIGK
jgi:hypothetical protein